MANVDKFARSAVGQLCQHYERKKQPDGSYIKFNNEMIDPSRTHLNYNLAPDRNQIDFINQRCSEVKCMNRADVNVMVTWVVTQPKDFPPERGREFFEQTYKFLTERYGGEHNVISSFVHMDEVTPHIHFAFVPVVKDKKSGIEKVSAKEAITKTELSIFHKDLRKHLNQYFGFEVNVLNGATKGGNMTIKELKANEKIEVLTQKLSVYENMEVAVDEVGEIGKKQLIGRNIVITPEQLKSFQDNAKTVIVNKPIIENIKEREKNIGEKEARAESAKKMADDAWLAARAEKNKYEQKHREVESLYNQQINLNQRYEQANVRIRDLVQEKKNEAAKFQEEKRLLLETAENQKKVIAEKNKLIDNLKNLCRDIYSSFANAMKAVKTLKNKKSKYYVDSISEDTSRLIDSVVDYSADWAKADSYPDLARDIRENAEVSEGIQKWIDEKTPKVKSRGMSL